jgi:hypothetical protein
VSSYRFTRRQNRGHWNTRSKKGFIRFERRAQCVYRIHNRTLTLGEAAAEFHSKTDCSPVDTVGQYADLARIHWRHETVTDHGSRVAVAAQDLQT